MTSPEVGACLQKPASLVYPCVQWLCVLFRPLVSSLIRYHLAWLEILYLDSDVGELVVGWWESQGVELLVMRPECIFFRTGACQHSGCKMNLFFIATEQMPTDITVWNTIDSFIYLFPEVKVQKAEIWLSIETAVFMGAWLPSQVHELLLEELISLDTSPGSSFPVSH